MNDPLYSTSKQPTHGWLRTSVEIEKAGQPVLLAILLGTLAIPIPKLNLFQNFWTKYFVGDIPGCMAFSTGIFVAVLCLALIAQRRFNSSWKSLGKSAKHLNKLLEKGVIDSKSCQIAFRWLFANVVLRHIGGDPKQALDVGEFMKNPSFQELQKELKDL
jgi:hypothetical protein